MKIKNPLGDWVVVEDIAIEDVIKTPGGLALKVDRTPLCVGRVVDIGPGRLNRDGVVMPMRVKVGEHVVYNAEMGTAWPDPTRKLVVFQEGAICATVEID